MSEQTLAELLVKESTLSFDHLLPILEDTLDALIVLHASGAVHGELAPETLAVHPEGLRLRAKLVVRAAARGNAACRAPELRGGAARPDARSDLFSLGAITFRALTGRWPFDAQFSSKAPTLSSVTGETWPAPLESWVGSLLARNPSHRLPNAELALDALVVLSRRVAATSRPPPG